MGWFDDAVAGMFGNRRRRRRHRREKMYREEMQRWAALVAFVNDEIAEGGGMPVTEGPNPMPTEVGMQGLVRDQVASFEDGRAFLVLLYEDSTGRVQQIEYKNETEWTLYIAISLPMGQPRHFSFPPNTPHSTFDIPQNARPNVGIDDLSIEGGFTNLKKGNN